MAHSPLTLLLFFSAQSPPFSLPQKPVGMCFSQESSYFKSCARMDSDALWGEVVLAAL